MGHGGADVAEAEQPKRGPLPRRLVPAGDVGDAHRERPAGDADAEGSGQHQRIGGRIREQKRRCRGGQHHQGEHQPPAVLVGPDAEQEPDDRAGQNGRADQQPELGVGKSQFILDLHADDGEDRPHGKADSEGSRRKPKRAALIAPARVCEAMHDRRPILGSRVNPQPVWQVPRAGNALIDICQAPEGRRQRSAPSGQSAAPVV